ncbi:MAG TPA: aldehyde dehydrogenase family protein, partial [Gemmatimonadaceae bacterium]|nr:aldehyde dehydrogenase family protein [Gemmatimonadaceae bacterium]
MTTPRAIARPTAATSSVPQLIFGDLWEYDPAPETADPKLKSKYDLFIGGKFVPSKAGKYFDSINPATEEVLAEIALANQADVDAAYQAAQKAFSSWSKLPGTERGKYLYRIARLIQDRAREFAVAESMDGGKPIKESRDFDVPMTAAHFFYHAGWADKLEYAVPGARIAPLGVIGQVIPWNFPLLMLAWKIAPALAMGNTVVLKPAETTSVTAMKFAELLLEAELPAGVVNIVTGAGETGAAVVTHPTAAKIAFTGSTEVGKIIMRQLAGTDKKLTLELGGKAANIVFDDSPIDQAVEGVVNGIFFNQGHVCCAGSRLLVQESIAEMFVSKLKNRIDVLRVGNPLDKNTDVGAINSKAQLDRICELVDSGVTAGAEMYQSAVCQLPTTGFYFKPTVFTGVTQSHRIAREEIFGPVLSVLTFRTLEEAVEKA